METKRKRDIAIDYLKTICMILIIITHYSWTMLDRERYLFPYWIDLAVPVLMIITGSNYYQSIENNSDEKWVQKKYLEYLGLMDL